MALAFSIQAGTKSAARTALESGNFQKTIQIVEGTQLKTAEDYYLIGQAYFETNDKIKAQAAWMKTIEQNKTANLKWAFLFSPNKTLKAADKKQIYQDFMAQYKSLTAAVISLKKEQAKTASRDAARTKVDASRLDATAKNLDKKAEASSEKIQSQIALKKTQKSQKAPVRKSGGKMPMIIGVVILVLIILFFVFGRSSEVVYVDAEFGSHHYSPGYDDGIFTMGPFWYKGRYYHDHHAYHSAHGSYYSNRMYSDNYDSYGRGQGRDMALDQEILSEIDERQELREDAADAALDADNLRADAEDLNLDAQEAQEDIAEMEESLESLEEEPDFSDDEEEPDFEDDEPEEEEPEFEDDEEEEEPEEEEPEFEDDEEDR